MSGRHRRQGVGPLASERGRARASNGTGCGVVLEVEPDTGPFAGLLDGRRRPVITRSWALASSWRAWRVALASCRARRRAWRLLMRRRLRLLRLLRLLLRLRLRLLLRLRLRLLLLRRGLRLRYGCCGLRLRPRLLCNCRRPGFIGCGCCCCCGPLRLRLLLRRWLRLLLRRGLRLLRCGCCGCGPQRLRLRLRLLCRRPGFGCGCWLRLLLRRGLRLLRFGCCGCGPLRLRLRLRLLWRPGFGCGCCCGPLRLRLLLRWLRLLLRRVL